MPFVQLGAHDRMTEIDCNSPQGGERGSAATWLTDESTGESVDQPRVQVGAPLGPALERPSPTGCRHGQP